METPNPQNTKPPNPREISELQKAVNEASLRTAALWVSFMSFAAYLTVAVGSVDHLKLFKETAIKLPILAAELPLVAFFAISPFFLLLFHFYLFLNLVALSRRISTYNRVLTEDVKGEDDQNLLRSRLDTFLVVQLLSRPPQEPNSLHIRLLNFVAWITLIGMPILLLLQFQLTFLPYHDSIVTWIHRFLIGADLILIWSFGLRSTAEGNFIFRDRDSIWSRLVSRRLSSSFRLSWCPTPESAGENSERPDSHGVLGKARSAFRLLPARTGQHGDGASAELLLQCPCITRPNADGRQ
jgi:hypothetical protein